MNEIYLLSPWVDQEYRLPINSLKFIKYYLEDNGYNATVIDCARYSRDLHEVMEILRRTEKPIIGVTGYSRERFHAYDLIGRIRRAVPESVIVVGGRHFGSLAEETLKNLQEVDLVVRGEGEIAFKEICDAVCNNGSFGGIAGVSYRENGKAIHNAERIPESNLDLFRCSDVKKKLDLDRNILLSQRNSTEAIDTLRYSLPGGARTGAYSAA